MLKLVAGVPIEDSTVDPKTIGKDGTFVLTELTKYRLTVRINNMIIFKSSVCYLELL